MMLTRKLSLRLVLTIVAIQCLLLAVAYSYFFIVNPDVLIDHILDEQVEGLEENIFTDENGLPAIAITLDSSQSKEWIYKALPSELRYQLVDYNGKVVYSPLTSESAFVAEQQAFIPKAKSYITRVDGQPMYAIDTPLSAPYQQYLLQVATSKRILDIFELTRIKPLSRITLHIILVSLILTSIVAIVTVRYMLKPLRQISDSAAQISPQNLTQRLQAQLAPTEISPLIQAFNLALDRLELGYRVQQDLLASTAHELKTPLALIRGEIEHAENLTGRDVILTDIDALARQIYQILHLAEVQESRNYKFTDTEVLDVIEEVILFLKRLAQQKNLSIALNFDEDISPLLADRSMLFTLIKNLLENAIIHSTDNQQILVELSKNRLKITNKGQQIPPDYLPHLFKRFWRSPERRDKGAGLGLAICQEIADVHHWQLSVESDEDHTSFILKMN